jgi:hypothetical protein
MTDRRRTEELGGGSNGSEPHKNHVFLGVAEGTTIDFDQLTGS